jgi:hypothetical protein
VKVDLEEVLEMNQSWYYLREPRMVQLRSMGSLMMVALHQSLLASHDQNETWYVKHARLLVGCLAWILLVEILLWHVRMANTRLGYSSNIPPLHVC